MSTALNDIVKILKKHEGYNLARVIAETVKLSPKKFIDLADPDVQFIQHRFAKDASELPPAKVDTLLWGMFDATSKVAKEDLIELRPRAKR